MSRVDRKTILCDIDGTLLFHKKNLTAMVREKPIILKGVVEKLLEWREKDYYIILTTARPEGCRNETIKQLAEVGIFYDQLVMGLTVGPRVVINDRKPNGLETAVAVSLERNEGISEVEI